MDNHPILTTIRRRHRDRVLQTPIYLGKLLRGFIYQSDWKVLPMCVLIAALLSLVVRNTFFISREGTLKGAFALTCVALWNGCFNAILAVCRERRIVKREHRSGMHISAYMFAHMVYQALLCLLQTLLTLLVCQIMGVQFPAEGLITPWFLLDLGITVFLITYAAAMTSLLFSSLAHTTTAALTIMPFLLIFQLVFSGGIFSMPAWTQGLTNFTLSNYGLKCIAAQADYNSLPMTLAWDTLYNCSDTPIRIEMTGDDIIDIATSETSPVAEALRTMDVGLPGGMTVGAVLDTAVKTGALDAYRSETVSGSFTLRDVFELVGMDNVRNQVIQLSSEASRNEAYNCTQENILSCWLSIIMLGAAFAILSVLVMELIDNDKR